MKVTPMQYYYICSDIQIFIAKEKNISGPGSHFAFGSHVPLLPEYAKFPHSGFVIYDLINYICYLLMGRNCPNSSGFRHYEIRLYAIE
jgi:hypothetical protein